MVQDNEVLRYVQMEPVEDGGGSEVSGRLGFQVVDENQSPFEQATITVTGPSYKKSDQPGVMGSPVWFEEVPLPANFTIEATGYKNVSGEITESDLGTDQEL